MYKYITHIDSPNFTRGRPQKIDGIVIHWWNSPDLNPGFDGAVRTLCDPRPDNPDERVSAHYVVEAGKVACLVAESNTAWHARAANPHTIGIECNPRASAADIETIAELVSQIRKRYGNLPLYPHSRFVATQCPGVYKNLLPRISARAHQISAGKTTPSIATTTSKGETMKNVGIYWDTGNNTIIYALFNPVSGFWHTFGNGTGRGPLSSSYNNPLAAAFATGSWVKVTKSHAEKISNACEQVRNGK